MSLPLQPYKGTRDFYPEDKRLQDYLFNTIRASVKSYGYEEYDAPLIESIELYKAKSGSEIVNEQTYAFIDRGGREVAIRPEMTPSVSRMVAARRQQLAYPLRWFSIPNLWRYERPQRGRLREHWQLNVDLFGVKSYHAELELIMLADAILRAFGADRSMYQIKVSHRQLLDYVLADLLGLNHMQARDLARLIDRKEKLEQANFIEQVDAILSPSQRQTGATEQLLSLLKTDSIAKLPAELAANPAASELRSLMLSCQKAGIDNVRFDIGLVRGFDYYSGIVFELYDTNTENQRSMMGGGRYDGLVGLFGVEPLPTAGFGLGDATLLNFLELHGLLPELDSNVDLSILVIGDETDAAILAAQELRKFGLNVSVDLSAKKIGEQIKAAQKMGLRYVLIIGSDEAKTKKYTLRDLKTSKEVKSGLREIKKLIKSS